MRLLDDGVAESVGRTCGDANTSRREPLGARLEFSRRVGSG